MFLDGLEYGCDVEVSDGFKFFCLGYRELGNVGIKYIICFFIFFRILENDLDLVFKI